MKNRYMAFLAALLVAGSSVHAQDTLDFSQLSDTDLLNRYNQANKLGQDGDCTALLALLAEMTKRQNFNGPIDEQKDLAEFRCAIREYRWKDAAPLLAAVESHLQRNLGSLGYTVALFGGKLPDAGNRLVALAEAADAKDFLSIENDLIYELARNLHSEKLYAERKAVFVALSNSPHFSKLPTDLQSGIAGIVIDEEARDRKFERTPKLLKLIDSPYNLREWLASKRFEQIWPMLESEAGPGMTRIIERGLANDMARFKSDRDDRQAFQRTAHSLHFAGKFEEVVKFVSSINHSAAGIAKAQEDDAWALNVEAYALDALGRTGEAEQIFERLAAIPYDAEENGWLVSFVINRGSRLVEFGQWQKGLDAATYAGSIAEKSGNDYSKMLIRRDKICALHGLGRGKEAATLVEEIRSRQKDNYSIAAVGLLCAGDSDGAARAVISGLTDEDQQDSTIADLQKPEFEFFYSQAVLPSLREKLLVRPDVRAAFDAVARDIPDIFMPPGGKRKAEAAAKIKWAAGS